MTTVIRPGAQPANQPAAFEFLNDSRLLSHRNITSMPTTQREWHSFIIELNKLIKNETGNFDPVFTGFSADPASASCWWHRYGQLVHMEFVFTTGTSNATGFTITNLPAIITPRDNQIYPLIGLHDNSLDIADRGSVKVGSDKIITFYPDNFAGAWTASGAKGFAAGSKSVIYSLRNPEKL